MLVDFDLFNGVAFGIVDANFATLIPANKSCEAHCFVQGLIPDGKGQDRGTQGKPIVPLSG